MPLSPHVYWCHEGRLVQLTGFDAFGHHAVAYDEDFMDVLQRVLPDFGAA